LQLQALIGILVEYVVLDMDILSTDIYMWRRAVPRISRKWWKDNRDWADGTVPAIPLDGGSFYDVREAHRRAHDQHDPLLAPHGMFRALPPGRNTGALEFVEKFGPLDGSLMQGKPADLVFDDFWLKHLRYVSVVRLWEVRDTEALRSAFSDLYKNLDQIHFAEGSERFEDAPPNRTWGWGRFGAVPLYPLGTTDASRRRIPMPWEKAECNFEEWLGGTKFAELREAAITILHHELNLHVRRRPVGWLRTDSYSGDPLEPVSFQLFVGAGNLWERIWELTGLDTAPTRSWRICPHCNTIFYPKRSDQFYCTSREQVLASKRNYIRARRERERLKKLLENADAAGKQNKPRAKSRRSKSRGNE
jgi:hypothetical protein